MANQQRLKPRKKPVQARSIHTVDAIFEACIQVLTDIGGERLTTSRVAERAGVSVGTLYQYFPNKEALLAAVLEVHLLAIVTAVEEACRAAQGQTVGEVATTLVQTFMRAKFADADASRALYAIANTVGGEELVARLTQRTQLALCELLATAADRHFEQVSAISYVLSTALVGPVQGLLASRAAPPIIETIGSHLISMTRAYLETVGSPKALRSDQ